MHVTLTILYNAGEYHFLWTSDPAAGFFSPPNEPVDPTLGATCLTGVTRLDAQKAGMLHQSVNAAAHALHFSASTSDFGASMPTEEKGNAFDGLGRILFAHLTPDLIQQQMRALPTGATLQIITNDANLPWELLHDGDDFLALKHCVARLPGMDKVQRHHQPPERTARRACLLLGNPTGDLPATVAEISAIEDILYTAKERVRYRSLFGDHISVSHLRSLLATQEYDLIHYAGHAQPGALALAGEYFRVEDILTALHNHPLVVLNACATGRARATATNISEMASETQSLATAFIQAGATAVIGMLWPIPDRTSMLFAQLLYTQLVAGETIGEALRLSRERLRQQDPQGIAWLAPVLYGNPRQRAIPAAVKEAVGTVLTMRFHGPMVDQQRVKQSKPNDRVHYLTLLCQRISQHGGFVLSATEAGLLAAFGLYQATDSNAFQAMLAARDVLERAMAWQTHLPAIAVVSGELVATWPEHKSATNQVAAAPFVFGPAVVEAQQLLTLAAPGQILVNPLARMRCKDQFHCRLWYGTTRSGDQVAAYELVPLPSTGEVDRVALDFTVMVGREAEQQRLAEAWQAAQTGRGQVMGISGEAGIGKTHLVRSFRERVSRDQGHWLHVACTVNVKHTTYGLLARLFRALLALPNYADEQQIEAVLRQHFTNHPSANTALLADLLGMQQQELHRQEQSVYQHQLYLLLTHLLLQTMQQTPVLLILEDAHWSDVASLEVLTLLAAHLEEAPLLILLVYRSDWQPPWVGKEYFQNLQLRPLGRTERQKLYTDLLQTTQLPDELIGLLERSSGNPLFLTEILVTLLHKGLLTNHSGANASWQLTGTLPAHELPDSVQRVIDMRLDQLAPDARAVLAMAALLGASFTPAMLRWGLTWAEDVLYGHLKQLTAHDFLRHTLGSDHYDFRHALIRDIAYMKLATPQRQLWHRQVAEALERQDFQRRESVAALAHHYFQSLVDERADDSLVLNREADPATAAKALTYLLQSGQDALDKYGGREAVLLLQRARLVQALLAPAGERLAQIYTNLGHAYRQINDFEQAINLYVEAYATLHRQPLTLTTRPLAADLARLLARLYMRSADYAMADAWIETGLEHVRGYAHPACQAAEAMLQIHAGSICYNRGALQRAVEACQAGLQLALACEAVEAQAEGNFILGAILQTSGNYAESLTYYRHSLAIHEQRQDLYQIHRVEGNIGVICYSIGDWAQALSHYEKAGNFWRTIGELDLLAIVLLNTGLVELCRGNHTQAHGCYMQALTIWQGMKSQRWLARCHSNLGSLFIEQEAWSAAAQQLALSQALLDQHQIQDLQPDVLCGQALVVLANQQPDTALLLAQQAEQLAIAQEQRLDQALALRVQGQALCAKADVEQAVTRLHQSQMLLKQLNAHYETARTTYQLALAWEQNGDVETALQHCDAALTAFAQLGAQHDLQKAVKLRTRLVHPS